MILLWSSGRFHTSYMITLRAEDDRTAQAGRRDAGTAIVVDGESSQHIAACNEQPLQRTPDPSAPGKYGIDATPGGSLDRSMLQVGHRGVSAASYAPFPPATAVAAAMVKEGDIGRYGHAWAMRRCNF